MKYPFDQSLSIRRGNRGKAFEKFIREIFKRTSITDQYVDLYVGNHIKFFEMAFTSSSADPTDNYELFEQMGDATIGKYIVWDAYEKYPQFKGNPAAVEIVARMKIVFGSKTYLSRIAEELNMWQFASCSQNLAASNRTDLLEDMFEALIGAVEFVVKDKTNPERSYPGLAYGVVYELLSNLFEPYIMEINYDVLVDVKNRLQGVFDEHKLQIGPKPAYYTRQDDKKIHHTTVSLNFQGLKDVLGTGSAYVKKDSEKMAAEKAIEKLRSMKYKKTIPAIYQFFLSK